MLTERDIWLDQFDRETNEGNIKRGQELLRIAKSYGDAAHARALIRAGIDAEIRRLDDKLKPR